MPTTRPNVVMVLLDTARASAFEPWGAPPGATPTIAQLASRGTAAPTAIAPCCWTMPSHAALFTGLLPRTAGLAHQPGERPTSCRPVMEAHRDRILPEVLRRAGYATAAASANVWIAEPHGFATGFDTFVDVRGTRDTRLDRGGRRAELRWMYEALVARVDDGLSAATEVVDTWLASAPRQPFFWFFNLLECHSPYLPPRPWNDLGPVQRMRAAREARRHLTLGGIWRACAGGFDIPPDALERMRHGYAGSIAMLDNWIGRLLEKLDRAGVLDDTIVVVTADHGENLGEGDLIGHAFSLDDRLIRVPLVVSGPDPLPVPALMSIATLPKLIGTAVGLASNPWARDDALPDGVAVAQYDALVAEDDPRALDAVRQWRLGDDARRVLTSPMTAATDGTHKLVRHGNEFRLYDLVTDPLERTPRAVADPGAEVPRLMEAMTRADATDADPELVAAIVAGHEGDADPGLEEQLRLLGYL